MQHLTQGCLPWKLMSLKYRDVEIAKFDVQFSNLHIINVFQVWFEGRQCYSGRRETQTYVSIVMMRTVWLTLRQLITTKYCLLVHLKSLCSKKCGPRSDCSFRIWVHTVCLHIEISHRHKHLHSADDFSRQHFQMHFFIADKVLILCILYYIDLSVLDNPMLLLIWIHSVDVKGVYPDLDLHCCQKRV